MWEPYLHECSHGGTTVPFWLTAPKTPHSLLRFLPPFPPWSWDSGGTHIPGELGDCIGLRSYHSSCIPRCRENCENAIKKGHAHSHSVSHQLVFVRVGNKKRENQPLYSRWDSCWCFGRSEPKEYSFTYIYIYTHTCYFDVACSLGGREEVASCNFQPTPWVVLLDSSNLPINQGWCFPKEQVISKALEKVTRSWLGGESSNIFGIFTPRKNWGKDEPILLSIFFKWVSLITTN